MRRIGYKAAALGAAAISLFSAACGGGGNGGDAAETGGGGERTIDVSMIDNSFEPNSISVAAGETVTFLFTNNGSMAHDAFIGPASEQEEHGQAMDSGEGMEGHNMEGSDALLLEPGDSGELTYSFEEAGEILIGCHQPGHYEAGMKATITVS